MKNTFLIMFLALLSACSARPERFEEGTAEEALNNETAQAEVVEEQLPELEPLELLNTEPKVSLIGTMGMTQKFKVGDITVIHRVTPANQVVAARVYIDGGSKNLTPETQGIERLALDVSASGGTLNIPRDEFTSRLNSMGSEVFSFADRDFSGYGMKSVVENFETTWELMAEAAFYPAFPQEEIDVRRQQQLAEIASITEDPDSRVQYEASRLFFKGHSYFNLQIGVAENLQRVSSRKLAHYHRGLLKPERMLIVVVGNVPTSKLTDMIKSSFARLPSTGAEPVKPEAFTSEAGVEIVDQDLPTNYVLGYFEAPKPGTPQYPAMVVTMEFLRDRLFEEVRTKRNLTYAVSAGIGANRSNYGYLYVTATDPVTTMGVIFDQIAEVKLMQIPKQELDQVVNVFLTEHYMNLETNGGQAAMLARAELISGDWKTAEAFLAEVRAVTPEDVQMVAQRYLTNYRFGVVGKASALNAKTFQPR